MSLRTLALCIKYGATGALVLAMGGCVTACNVAMWRDDPILFGLVWFVILIAAAIGWATVYLDEHP